MSYEKLFRLLLKIMLWLMILIFVLMAFVLLVGDEN
jgi:hypothetical protein